VFNVTVLGVLRVSVARSKTVTKPKTDAHPHQYLQTTARSFFILPLR